MNSTHDSRRLHSLDLNLLAAFDALACERNVTRAAARAGVSQSAMSHTLRRLRELFGDPLFVRARGGVALTPRAESLVVPVRSGLLGLVRALEQPPEFDPATARRVFRIVSPDLFDVLVLPALLARLGREAPGLDLAVVPTPENGLDDALEAGEIDLAVVPVLTSREPFDGVETPGGHLQRRTLLRDGHRVFVRAGSPLVSPDQPLTLERYAALPHLLISPTGVGPGLLDRYLERAGLGRRIALRVPHFASAMAIVAASDLVLTAPASLARAALPGRVMTLDLPLDVPEHGVAMVWHTRFAEEPGHRWFRQLLVGVAGGNLVTTAAGPPPSTS